MGELFASDVKGVASAIAVMFNWTLVFIITKGFGTMKATIGSGESQIQTVATTKIDLCSLRRPNILRLRRVHGRGHDFRLHQSTGDERQVERSDSSDSCGQEVNRTPRDSQKRNIRNHHHHIETKSFSQVFFLSRFVKFSALIVSFT